jgi:hypothetical protein
MKTNNMTTKFFAIVVIGLITFTACEKSNTNDVDNRPVVEAYLQPGQQVQVKISKQVPVNASSGDTYGLTNLQVNILHNNSSYPLSHVSDGLYINNNIPVVVGGSYRIEFSYEGTIVTASTIIPSKPTNFTASASTYTVPTFGGGAPSLPSPITLSWSNPQNNYHYAIVKSLEANPTEINSRFGGGAVFPNSPDQGSSKQINLTNFKYYGRHAILLYHVLPEYTVIFNSSGSTSQNISNINTNVINGLGIFTGITSADSLFITVN